MKRMKVWFWVALLLVGGVDANAQVPACKADLNGNGVVDFADFLIFAQHYGKTNLVSCQPDTVEKVVRDTIYIDGGSGGNQGTQTDSLITPPGLAGLDLRFDRIPTGWKIIVEYIDLFGNEIINGVLDVPQWRNPDKITVTIISNNRELYISDNLIYKGYWINGNQYGLEVLIPKSEIPPDLYNNPSLPYSSTIPRVVVEFDGQEYFGGDNPVTPTDSLSIPRGLASLGVLSRKIPTGISISVDYLDLFGTPIQVIDEIWRNPDKITVTVNRDNRELYRSTDLPYQRDLLGETTQLGIDLLIPKSEIPVIYADWSYSHTIRVVVEFDGQEYSN